jgi:iron(III) transport system substrate-binding protein
MLPFTNVVMPNKSERKLILRCEENLHSFRVFPALFLVLMILACGNESERRQEAQTSPPSTNVEQNNALTLYSGRGAILIEPLLTRFTNETGIPVEVRYEKSTQTLANRIAAEGSQTDADVFFAQDSGWLGALGEAGHLATLPTETLEQVSEHYRDPDGKWIGTSGRARVLVYSPGRIRAEDLPQTLADLPRFAKSGRFGWAPGNGSFQAHVSALRHLWGEEETRTWLEAMQALEPTVYPKNSPQVRAVDNGEIDIGWVNHYYLHKLRTSNPELEAANYSFPTAQDAGNLMMLSGVAIMANSKHSREARAFVNYLLTDQSQQYFANETFEYPSVSSIALHPDVPPIGDKMIRADQTHLTDLSGTLRVLRAIGLQ